MARINSYPRTTNYSMDDVILMDSAKSGTRTILVSTLEDVYNSKVADLLFQDGFSDSDQIVIRTSAGDLKRVAPQALRTAMGLDDVEATTAITTTEIDQMFEELINGTAN